MFDAGWIMALWAMMVPIVMMVLFFAPLYFMAVVCLWNVYGDEIWRRWSDVSLVLTNMEHLFNEWQRDPELTIFNYFLPVFGPLGIGLILSGVLNYLFYRYIRSVFEVS
jgi:hypothetical protein